MADDNVSLDMEGLDKFEAQLRKMGLSIKIGIMSGDIERRADENEEIGDLNNAQLGLIHEFGSVKRNIKKNSFLREPLLDNLNKRLEQEGLFKRGEFEKLLEQGKTPEEIGNRIGAIGLGIIMEAFASSGYGKWSNIHGPNSKTGMVLVNDGQLRDSISYEVSLDK